jgi:hypothetical protein|tara:strand:+ start:607 stop:951 length:345 start_codon:yes stop_codon:yes gene_type:complete
VAETNRLKTSYPPPGLVPVITLIVLLPKYASASNLGSGVAVGGTGVAVGAALEEPLLEGTGVAVGAAAGTGVAVGAGLGVGVGSSPPQAMPKASNAIEIIAILIKRYTRILILL